MDNLKLFPTRVDNIWWAVCKCDECNYTYVIRVFVEPQCATAAAQGGPVEWHFIHEGGDENQIFCPNCGDHDFGLEGEKPEEEQEQEEEEEEEEEVVKPRRSSFFN